LISATKPGMTASFTYDGDGNRVEKNVNGTVTRYMVDGNNLTGYAQVVEELDAANAVQVVYTYGLDLISQSRKGFLSWTTSYYGYDATGTTRMLFDDSGTVTDTYTYEAFGTIINRTGTTTNAYLFHGEQYDADLGLYYLRARYMDNTIGRFITMDGFEGNNKEPFSLHKYTFANSSPINCTDPSGYLTLNECMFIGAALGIIFQHFRIQYKTIYENAKYSLLEAFALEATGGVVGGTIGFLAYFVGLGGPATAAFLQNQSSKFGKGGENAGSSIEEVVSLTKILRRNMINGGIKPFGDEAAHHIVARGSRAADFAGAHLSKLNINIDDPINGVFLPSGLRPSGWTGLIQTENGSDGYRLNGIG